MKRMMIITMALLFAVALLADGHRMHSAMKQTGEAMQKGEACGEMQGNQQMKARDCGGGGCGMMQMGKAEKMGSKSGCPMMKGKKQMHPEQKKDAMMMVKHLNLTDEQQAQYKELHYQAKLDKIKLNADIEALKLKRSHALKRGDFGEATKLNKALYEKKAALYALDIELKMKLYDMLDDNQRALWSAPKQKDCGR